MATSQTLIVGASVQLGVMGQWAGRTIPAQSVQLNAIRQGTGKFWRGTDNSATAGTTRQLGLLRLTNYRCVQGQNQGTYAIQNAAVLENVNIQGNLYNGAPTLALNLAASSVVRMNGNCIGAGGAGGIGAGTPAARQAGTGGNGSVGVSSTNSITIYALGTIAGGGGGGGGGGSSFDPSFTYATGGGGGGGGASFGAGGAYNGGVNYVGQFGQAGSATAGGSGGSAGVGPGVPPGGIGGNGGGAGQAGQAGTTGTYLGGAPGGAAGQKSQGTITFL